MSFEFPLRLRITACAVAGILVASPLLVSSAPIFVKNQSFEITTGMVDPGNEFFFGVNTDWAIYDPNTIVGNGAGSNDIFLGTLEPDEVPGEFFTGSPPEGDQVAILFGFGNGPAHPTAPTGAGEYGIEQELAAALEANTKYTLEVEVGNIGEGTGSGGFFPLDGFPGYRIELIAGSTVLAIDDDSLSIAEYEFETSTIMFTVGAAHANLGELLKIRLINLNQIPIGNDVNAPFDLEVDFDDVRLSAVSTIPEPASLGLLAAGLLGVGFRKRKA